METCHYDTNHWPCNYCSASSPDSEDACCKYPEKEEKLVCPLCGEEPTIINAVFLFEIRCYNRECLSPHSFGGSMEEAVKKWKKYAR